jgi:hypothetical protein
MGAHYTRHPVLRLHETATRLNTSEKWVERIAFRHDQPCGASARMVLLDCS